VGLPFGDGLPVGVGVGVGVPLGVVVGVPLGLGVGVQLGVGFGVPLGVGVGVPLGLGVGVGVDVPPPQMMLDRTKKVPEGAPLAWAVAESRVSFVDVVNPVPSSGVWVPLWVKGPVYVTVPAGANTAVIDTNVARGLTP